MSPSSSSSWPRPSSRLSPPLALALFCYIAKYQSHTEGTATPAYVKQPQHQAYCPNLESAGLQPEISVFFGQNLLGLPSLASHTPGPAFCKPPLALTNFPHPRAGMQCRVSGLRCLALPLHGVMLYSSAQAEATMQAWLQPLSSDSQSNTVSTNNRKSISYPQVPSQHLLASKPSPFNI